MTGLLAVQIVSYLTSLAPSGHPIELVQFFAAMYHRYDELAFKIEGFHTPDQTIGQ